MIRQNMTRREVESIGKTLPRYQLVRVLNTFDLYVDNKDRSVAGCLARDGYWESWITSWMTKNIQTQWNCLDAGANFGYYTGIMSELAPEGKVVAVEANPTIAKLLNKSVKHNGWTNVQVIGYALGEKNSKKNLIIEDDLQGSAYIWDGVPREGNFSVIPVHVAPLDELTPLNFDLIKFDIEGSEQMAMLGAKRILSHNPLIIMEASGLTPPDFLEDIFKNYHVTRVDLSGNEVPVDLKGMKELDLTMLVLRKE